MNLIATKSKALEQRREQELSCALINLEVAEHNLQSVAAEKDRLQSLYDQLVKTVGTASNSDNTISSSESAGRRHKRHLARPVFDVNQSRKYATESDPETTEKDDAAVTITSMNDQNDNVTTAASDMCSGLLHKPKQIETIGIQESHVGGIKMNAGGNGMDIAQSSHRILMSSSLPALPVALTSTASFPYGSVPVSPVPVHGGSAGTSGSPSTSNFNALLSPGSRTLTAEDWATFEAYQNQRQQHSQPSFKTSSVIFDTNSSELYQTLDVNLSQGTSKLQGRLKTLLQSVQEQAGNAREIRQHYEIRRMRREQGQRGNTVDAVQLR